MSSASALEMFAATGSDAHFGTWELGSYMRKDVD
jgi:hypothetical protein